MRGSQNSAFNLGSPAPGAQSAQRGSGKQRPVTVGGPAAPGPQSMQTENPGATRSWALGSAGCAGRRALCAGRPWTLDAVESSSSAPLALLSRLCRPTSSHVPHPIPERAPVPLGSRGRMRRGMTSVCQFPSRLSIDAQDVFPSLPEATLPGQNIKSFTPPSFSILRILF